MSHSVSETAARAVKNSQRVKESEKTPEQLLKEIRGNVVAKLFVTPTHVQFLLAQYDIATAQYQDFAAKLLLANETINQLTEQIEQFRTVYEQENSSRGTVSIVAEVPVASEETPDA